MSFYLSLFFFSSSISFSPKLQKTQIWNLSWRTKRVQIKQTNLQLGTAPPTHVPRQASRASTTKSRDSSLMTSISRARSSHSLLWLSSEFSASSKTISQVPFLTSPTSWLLSTSSSLTTTSPVSSCRQCRLFSNLLSWSVVQWFFRQGSSIGQRFNPPPDAPARGEPVFLFYFWSEPP